MSVHIITEHPGNDTIIPNAFWITEGRDDVWETGMWIIWITAGNYKVQEVQCGVIPQVSMAVTHSTKHQGTPAHLGSRCCGSTRTVLFGLN